MMQGPLCHGFTSTSLNRRRGDNIYHGDLAESEFTVKASCEARLRVFNAYRGASVERLENATFLHSPEKTITESDYER